MRFKNLISRLKTLSKTNQFFQNSYLKHKYRNYSSQQIFSDIYGNNLWGSFKDIGDPFFSGDGSHDESLVSAYIKAIENFLKSFNGPLNVVDLGCGDFYVGSKIRPMCGNYIACDIVPELIEFNKLKYNSLNVDFRNLNLVVDQLPSGDLAFIRQVLQHLSNKEISQIIPKLLHAYKYIVVTEHLPAAEKFNHNIEKDTGPDIRLEFDSGVVLTSSPFNLEVKFGLTLCEVYGYGGVIRTQLYKLRD
ncbi:class I SAM-dependent methyltransferase [Polynucleobacter sp. es-GGE-1]|uniref:class I SAM-dependent methyltransferase n=1 Tax=Polynucleobacter sp. es-GGE-1 TaxID=1819724 RepID=UPI001C0CC40F|nr:class I SAM-dependent methyltransferase [Polynucleobacter sp. es-GGE-1]MBU3635525.1 class I SAM-dependent methyltransferase [Polynucleobacter sp. es-GGE-1]